MPKIIAITGNIGSGKSSAARLLQQWGALYIDADQIARQIVEPGQPALTEIIAAFGNGVLQTNGQLDRAALGRLIFADPLAKKKLESITHPRIGQAMLEAISTALAQNPVLVVVEVPLLFEGGLDKQFPAVLLITADDEIRLQRVMARDGCSRDQAQARLDAQMPQSQKIQLARWVVSNNTDKTNLEASLQKIWPQLTA